MELSFNELSLMTTSPSIDEAREKMTRFIGVIRATTRYGVALTIRTPRNFRQAPLAAGYVVENWIRDHTRVSKEERAFLLAVATKGPYAEEVFGAMRGATDCECLHDGHQATGLGIAYLCDSPAVGFSGQAYTDIDYAVVDVTYISDVDVVNESVEVCVLGYIEHVRARENWIRQRVDRERQLPDGTTLWRRRMQRFPRLIFCDSTRRFIEQIGAGDHSLRHIVRHLEIIDSTCDAWIDGPFDPRGIEWSNESGETMEHARYGPMRIFKCPDGKSRPFIAHSKIRGSNLRIHFFADDTGESRVVMIGYVGPHLPTVKYPT